jgi:hypothetical protein
MLFVEYCRIGRNATAFCRSLVTIALVVELDRGLQAANATRELMNNVPMVVAFMRTS